uniref:Beta-1,3-glucosyltransferase n=1 Tax=Steinernema glaseri TaxID=37863 RepID=A0A1I7ZIR2_9BILA
MYLRFLLILHALLRCAAGVDYGFVLLTQNFPYESDAARATKENVLSQARALGKKVDFILTHEDFPDAVGAWAFWPLVQRLQKRYSEIGTPQWLLIGESFTHFNLRLLEVLLKDADEGNVNFLGRALSDSSPSIVHHFDGFERKPSEPPFEYFDFSSGVAISQRLLEQILSYNLYAKTFTIDAKFEFTKFMKGHHGETLKSSKSFCYERSADCVAWFEVPDRSSITSCRPEGSLNKENVFFAVKTFSGFHKTRVVVIKRTWAREAKFVEYFSDSEDHYVPTIDLGVENTPRGHCEKTLRILKHFLEDHEVKEMNWLVVADDDTLLSLERLYRLLECFDEKKPLIVGQRYGYGFEADGLGGYDYPTGGSGMVFTRAAVELLAKNCECPLIDSPDDMVIGICARKHSIPIFHSSAFHQARSQDYPKEYLEKLPIISLHKFNELDPYKEYMDLLHTPSNRDEELSNCHEELSDHHEEL